MDWCSRRRRVVASSRAVTVLAGEEAREGLVLLADSSHLQAPLKHSCRAFATQPHRLAWIVFGGSDTCQMHHAVLFLAHQVYSPERLHALIQAGKPQLNSFVSQACSCTCQ